MSNIEKETFENKLDRLELDIENLKIDNKILKLKIDTKKLKIDYDILMRQYYDQQSIIISRQIVYTMFDKICWHIYTKMWNIPRNLICKFEKQTKVKRIDIFSKGNNRDCPRFIKFKKSNNISYSDETFRDGCERAFKTIENEFNIGEKD
eukprot:NODE_550_length_6175_cov_0.398453.p5 type:complete len:150 gc:universal NODE_550_length_6175_cov_0.398453:3712-4161(+)